MGEKLQILITGKNSFIGNAFKKHSSANFIINEVCLQDKKVSEINFPDYDVVFHVAALVHSTSDISYEEYYRVNVQLAFDIAQKAKLQGVKHFVFMSSVKVYGENTLKGEFWHEDSECKPEDNYGKSKWEAEKLLNTLHSKSFVVSHIRSAVVYGPEVKANILALIKLVNRFKVLPFGGIKNNRSFVFIENLITIIQSVITSSKEGVYLATDGKNVSTTELIRVISKHLGKKTVLISMPFKSLLCRILPVFNKILGSNAINNDKTLKALQLNLPYNLEKGMKSTVDWYLNNTK